MTGNEGVSAKLFVLSLLGDPVQTKQSFLRLQRYLNRMARTIDHERLKWSRHTNSTQLSKVVLKREMYAKQKSKMFHFYKLDPATKSVWSPVVYAGTNKIKYIFNENVHHFNLLWQVVNCQKQSEFIIKLRLATWLMGETIFYANYSFSRVVYNFVLECKIVNVRSRKTRKN